VRDPGGSGRIFVVMGVAIAVIAVVVHFTGPLV